MIPGEYWDSGLSLLEMRDYGKKDWRRGWKLCLDLRALRSKLSLPSAAPRSGSQPGQIVFCGRSRLQVEVLAPQDGRATGSRWPNTATAATWNTQSVTTSLWLLSLFCGWVLVSSSSMTQLRIPLPTNNASYLQQSFVLKEWEGSYKPHLQVKRLRLRVKASLPQGHTATQRKS